MYQSCIQTIKPWVFWLAQWTSLRQCAIATPNLWINSLFLAVSQSDDAKIFLSLSCSRQLIHWFQTVTIWNQCMSKVFNLTSIAYHKQLPPQRTVGTIGSVWQESNHSKETTEPAPTNTQAKLWKRTVGNSKRRTRGLCLSPRALANWF